MVFHCHWIIGTTMKYNGNYSHTIIDRGKYRLVQLSFLYYIHLCLKIIKSTCVFGISRNRFTIWEVLCSYIHLMLYYKIFVYQLLNLPLVPPFDISEAAKDYMAPHLRHVSLWVTGLQWFPVQNLCFQLTEPLIFKFICRTLKVLPLKSAHSFSGETLVETNEKHLF